MAVGKLLDRAATHQVQIVVTALDELIRRELARPQAAGERAHDLRRQIAQRAVTFHERVRDDEIGALAHRRAEERLRRDELAQLVARDLEHRARRVGHHGRGALRRAHRRHLADERGRAEQRERALVATREHPHRALDEDERVVTGGVLLDEHVALLQRRPRRQRAQTLAGGPIEQEERTEAEFVSHAAPCVPRSVARPR